MADVNISGVAAIVSSTSTPELLVTNILAGVASIASSIAAINLTSASNLSGVAAIVSDVSAPTIGIVKSLSGVASIISFTSNIDLITHPLGRINNTGYKSLTTRYGYII